MGPLPLDQLDCYIPRTSKGGPMSRIQTPALEALELPMPYLYILNRKFSSFRKYVRIDLVRSKIKWLATGQGKERVALGIPNFSVITRGM